MNAYCLYQSDSQIVNRQKQQVGDGHDTRRSRADNY